MIPPALDGIASAGWFQVFLLFMIPWGPGPVAGIILARKVGLSLGLIVVLYVLSDVLTAFVLDPIARYLRRRGEQSKIGRKVLESVNRLGSVTQVTRGRFGLPLGLFVFTFATDFFTAAIVSVGLPIYRIVAWIAIIAGDVLWFLILLLATIGVASFLSDDRILFLVTVAIGFALPPLVRRLLGQRQAPVSGPR